MTHPLDYDDGVHAWLPVLVQGEHRSYLEQMCMDCHVRRYDAHHGSEPTWRYYGYAKPHYTATTERPLCSGRREERLARARERANDT
jgi:hypothetical protein